MPRAESSPAEDRGDAMAIIERLHRAGWSIGDVPLRGERGGCAKTDGSCWSKSERGRGAWRYASEEGPGAVSSSANGGVLARGVGKEAVDPRAGRHRSDMIRTPRVRAADLDRDQGRRADPQISPQASASIAIGGDWP